MTLPKPSSKSVAVVFTFVLISLSLLVPHLVQAAQLTITLVRLDRIKAATTTTGTVCVKPTTTATEADVQVTFPTGFTLGTAGNFTVNTTNLSWPTGASAWPGIGTATNVSSQTVTFPSSDLTIGTLYCFNWTNSAAVTTPGANNDLTGTVTTRTSTPTNIDTGNYAVSIISSDQINVTATVPATFSFSLSGNTASFGTLSSGSITSTTAINATFSTNATSGVIGWIASANGALTSAATGASISSPGSLNATPETLSAGTSGYVLDVDTNTNGTAGTGAVTIDPEYDGNTTSKGGHLQTANSLQPIFTTNGTHQSGIVNLIFRAAISAVQAAASDYTDTITVMAAGRF